MKKILIISNSCWNIFNFRKELIYELNKKKFQITVCAPYDNYYDRIKNIKINYIDVKFSRKSYNIFSNFKLILFYVKCFYKLKPDIIFMYTIKPNIFGSLASLFFLKKKNTYNFITGLGTFFFEKSIYKFLILLLYKISLHSSSNVIFQNKYDLEYFINKKITFPKKSILISGSGVNIKYFEFSKLKYKKNKELTFLCSSRLIKDKGIIEYIEVAKLIKSEYTQVNFNLLGSLDRENSSCIDENLLISNYKYVKHIDFTDDIKKYLVECDCFVLPSYREGTSRSLLEALSIGRPLITTNVPGCNNIVKNDYNGYLCDKKNIESLFQVIKKMINTPFEIRKKMSINSRKLAENKFDVNIINKQILKIII